MLKLKRIHIDTHRENVAFLHTNCTTYRAEELEAIHKIEVSCGPRKILAVVNIVGNGKIVSPDEIGLSEQAFHLLGLKDGASVDIAPAVQPHSLQWVRSKIQGETLPPKAFKEIINDIAAHRYSKMELSAFLVACAGFMTTDEVLSLTRAMAGEGTRLSWNDDLIVDKHCIGGIPGNRTTMVVVPIVAAYGLPIPKTSSRSITSPAGTADTMEVLANVSLDIVEMQELVLQERGCLAWGGHMNLAPADDVMISVERPLNIDTPEQMVASILSKKISAGSTHLIIDIPIGPNAKVQNQAEAIRLRKLFEYVGKKLGLVMEVIVTDGSQPIGRGIGPALEARDVMKVLKRDPDAPRDLREKSLMLAGMVLDFDPSLPGQTGYQRAREILDTGQALASMEAIIDAQGRVENPPEPGEMTFDVLAPKSGKVTEINCQEISMLAQTAGAPQAPGAGLDLFKKVGDPVKKGEALYRVHCDFESDFDFVQEATDRTTGYTVE